ncbi:hypothetical protein [Sporomusa malonica]|uniref:Uncharacterized protein n=1 Tax=Sporomusa malonica TaxID=112901 RepID=A0A1W2EVQ4_9FIRM|nr:hypothetical protein [Sporomusa malonica]SMD13248.1 hypothetical protein SAMN04488500_13038 [Sporomusa malonica]
MIKYTFEFRNSSFEIELNNNNKIFIGDEIKIVLDSNQKLVGIDLRTDGCEKSEKCVVSYSAEQLKGKYIELQQREVYEPHVILVYEHLKEYVSLEFVETALRKVASRLNRRQLYIENEYHNSLLGRIIAVAARLELGSRLNNEEVAKRLNHQQEALYTYLLLTCFDLLGQPTEWKTYEAWLSSSNTEAERQRALNAFVGDNILENSKQLYLEYQKIYGVKNAFFRFLRTVLPRNIRYKLLDSLRIIYYKEGQKVSLGKVVDKENYLFAMRNNYTHKAYFLEGNVHQYIPMLVRPNSFKLREQENINSTVTRTVYTQSWPHKIKFAVQKGLLKYLQDIDQDVKNDEWLPPIVKPYKSVKNHEGPASMYYSEDFMDLMCPPVRE